MKTIFLAFTLFAFFALSVSPANVICQVTTVPVSGTGNPCNGLAVPHVPRNPTVLTGSSVGHLFAVIEYTPFGQRPPTCREAKRSPMMKKCEEQINIIGEPSHDDLLCLSGDSVQGVAKGCALADDERCREGLYCFNECDYGAQKCATPVSKKVICHITNAVAGESACNSIAADVAPPSGVTLTGGSKNANFAEISYTTVGTPTCEVAKVKIAPACQEKIVITKSASAGELLCLQDGATQGVAVACGLAANEACSSSSFCASGKCRKIDNICPEDNLNLRE